MIISAGRPKKRKLATGHFPGLIVGQGLLLLISHSFTICGFLAIPFAR
jgi:hypothetical protein